MAESTADAPVSRKIKECLSAQDLGGVRAAGECNALGRASAVQTAIVSALAWSAVDAHENGKVLDGRRYQGIFILRKSSVKKSHARVVFRRPERRYSAGHDAVAKSAGADASRSRHLLIVEELIGQAQFDIGGFSGKEQQGLVLRLPAEFAHGAVVWIMIEMAVNRSTQRTCCGGNAVQVGLKGGFRSVFHQSQAKSRRGSTENHIVKRALGGKIRLRQHTVSGITPSLCGEKLMHTAIQCVTGGVLGEIEDETGLLNRAIGCNERRHHILRAQGLGGGDLRVLCKSVCPDTRAGASNRWLRMAHKTTRPIEGRPQPRDCRIPVCVRRAIYRNVLPEHGHTVAPKKSRSVVWRAGRIGELEHLSGALIAKLIGRLVEINDWYCQERCKDTVIVKLRSGKYFGLVSHRTRARVHRRRRRCCCLRVSMHRQKKQGGHDGMVQRGVTLL